MLSKFKFIQIKEELSHLRADIVLTVTKRLEMVQDWYT